MSKKPEKYPKFKIKKTLAGKGFFADENIKKGTKVIQYIGVKVTNKYADLHPNEYIFWLNKTYSLDGSYLWNFARYVNYSHDPNGESIEEDKKIFFTAVKDIKKGEEFTIDYGRWHYNEFIKPFGCKCQKCLNNPKI